MITFQYFTHMFPKDAALSLTGFAHFQQIIFLTVSNIQVPGRKISGKEPSVSLSFFTIIIQSYLSWSLGQHCLFQGGKRGITDEDNFSCFTELNKNTQLHFTSLLTVEVRLRAHGVPVTTST